MKKSLIVLTSIAAISFGATALADETVSGPVMLTNGQMDQVVAGAEKAVKGPKGHTPGEFTTGQSMEPSKSVRDDFDVAQGGSNIVGTICIWIGGYEGC